jgi:hypothetical protein
MVLPRATLEPQAERRFDNETGTRGRNERPEREAGTRDEIKDDVRGRSRRAARQPGAPLAYSR